MTNNIDSFGRIFELEVTKTSRTNGNWLTAGCVTHLRLEPKNKLYDRNQLKQVGTQGTFYSFGTGWANVCNTPFNSYKHYTYEGGISTPMIIHYPQQLKTMEQSFASHYTSWTSRQRSLISAEPDHWNDHELYPIEGKSLNSLINGMQVDSRPLFFEHEGNRGVRDGKWKLVWTNYTKSWQLFDLEVDRTETRDIAREHPDKVETLSTMWLKWARHCHVELAKVPQPATGMPKIYYMQN